MIYITGDSFTFGDELGEDLHPNFPGYTGEGNPETIRRWSMSRPSNQDINEYRIANRWSSVLGNLLGEEIVNKSNPGKSIHGMVTNISLDLDIVQKSKIIFVQITGLHRFQLPYFKVGEGGWVQENYLQINPLMSNDNIFQDSKLNQFSKTKFLLNDDKEFLFDYLNQILLIQQLVNGVGSKLFIVDSVFLSSCGNILSLLDSLHDDNAINDMLIKTNFREEVTKFPSMWDIYNSNKSICKMMPCGHYCVNTHKLFAEKIYELLNTNA